MLTPGRITRASGAILSVGLIHYGFIGGDYRFGFGGIVLLVMFSVWTGPLIRRLVLLLIGAIALFGATGYAAPGASAYLLLAPPILANLGGMLIFGATLLPGRVPLITRFSRFDRKQTSGPLVDRHTRLLTTMWAMYFAVIVAVSLALALVERFAAASWVATVVSPAGSAAFFVLEHLYRRLRTDLFEQASILRTLKVIAHPDAWRGVPHDV